MNHWQVLKLPWNHHIRRNWRQKNFGCDPVVLGIVCAVGLFLLVPLCFYLTFDVYDLDDGKESAMEIIAGSVAILSPLVMAIFAIGLYGTFIDYSNKVIRVHRVFNIPAATLAQASHQELKAMVTAKMIDIFKEYLAIEKSTEEYYPERIDAKHNLKYVYQSALKTGIIDDVGYGPFFKAAQ